MTVAAPGIDAAEMEVVGRRMNLPASYGSPDRVLSWAEVEQKLVESKTVGDGIVILIYRPV